MEGTMQATRVSSAWCDGSGVCLEALAEKKKCLGAETSRGQAEPRIRKNRGGEALCILTLGKNLRGSSVLNGKCAGG